MDRAELGRRNFGDLSQGRINLLPFVYRFQSTLNLGSTGYSILGVVALLWTIDCFVGFYLTLPVKITKFWRKWRPSWLITRGGSFFRLNFDLHRASGLWLWAALFIFAWSSVYLNLSPIYDWVTGALFYYTWGTDASVAVPLRAADQPVPAASSSAKRC